jgi:hypothetical protein
VAHAILVRALGWTTFYGPMIISFARATDYTVAAFRRALMEAEPFDVLPDPDDPYVVDENGAYLCQEVRYHGINVGIGRRLERSTHWLLTLPQEANEHVLRRTFQCTPPSDTSMGQVPRSERDARPALGRDEASVCG